MNFDAAVWTILVIAALILVIYVFQAARTHQLQAQQIENHQKAVESQMKAIEIQTKAMDRQTEAMERIATALEAKR